MCEKLAMVKLDIHESLLTPSDLKSEVAGFQVVRHVSGLVNHDVTVRVVGLVGGSPHVRVVSGHAITSHIDVVWLESMILEQGPKNSPRRSHETGRQLRINGNPGSCKVQNERACGDLAQCDISPLRLHQPAHHGPNSLPDHS